MKRYRNRKNKFVRYIFSGIVLVGILTGIVTYAMAAQSTRTLDLSDVTDVIRDTTITKVKSKDKEKQEEYYIDSKEFLSNRDVQSNVPKAGQTTTGTFIADEGNGKTYIYKVSCDKDGDGIARYCTIGMELLRLKNPTDYESTNTTIEIKNDNEYYPGDYHGRESFTIFGEEYVRDSQKYGNRSSIPYAYHKTVEIKEKDEITPYKQVQYVDYKVKDPQNSGYSIDYKIFCVDDIVELLKLSGHIEWAEEIEQAMANQESYAIGFSPIFTYTNANSTGRFDYMGAVTDYDFNKSTTPIMTLDGDVATWLNVKKSGSDNAWKNNDFKMTNYSSQAKKTILNSYYKAVAIDFSRPQTRVAYYNIDTDEYSFVNSDQISRYIEPDEDGYIVYAENYAKDGTYLVSGDKKYAVIDNEDYSPVLYTGIKDKTILKNENLMKETYDSLASRLKIRKSQLDIETQKRTELVSIENKNSLIIDSTSYSGRKYTAKVNKKENVANLLVIPIKECDTNLLVRFINIDTGKTVAQDKYWVNFLSKNETSTKEFDHFSLYYCMLEDYIQDENSNKYMLCESETSWGTYCPLIAWDANKETPTGESAHDVGYLVAKKYLYNNEVSISDQYINFKYVYTYSGDMSGEITLYIPVKPASNLTVHVVDVDTGNTVEEFDQTMNYNEDGSATVTMSSPLDTENGTGYSLLTDPSDYGEYAPLFAFGDSDIVSKNYKTAVAENINFMAEVSANRNTDSMTVTYKAAAGSLNETAVLFVPAKKETENPMTVKYICKGDVIKTAYAGYRDDGSASYRVTDLTIDGKYQIVTSQLAAESAEAKEAYNSYPPTFAWSNKVAVLSVSYSKAMQKYSHVAATEKVEEEGVTYTVAKGTLSGSVVLFIPVMETKTGETSTPKEDDIVIVKNPVTGANTTSVQSGNNLAAPELRTYNESSDFDIGTAIPTTESFTNAVDCDTWYGTIGLKRTEVNKNITVEVTVYKKYAYYTYPYTKRVSYSYWDGHKYVHSSYLTTDYSRPVRNIGTVKSDYWTKVYDYKEGNDIKTYEYYTLSNLNLRQLVNVTIDNNCFNSSKQYTSDIIIPYSFTQNPYEGYVAQRTTTGTGSTVSSFVNNEWTHIQYPFTYDEVIKGHTAVSKVLPGVIDYGPSRNSSNARNAALAAANNYRTTLYSEYTKGKVLVMHSDTVSVNGTEYCNEYSGYSGSAVQIIGEEDNDKFIDSSLVNIPQMTENHLYSTRLTALYKKIAYGSGPTTIILNDRGADNADESGDEIETAIEPGYEENEPIAVHSPVISPFRVIDGETETQSLRENGTLTQLIPDKEYVFSFDWDNLFERYNDYTKGYDVPAGWTKYVDHKEVRFPFPVIMNGTYYPLKTTETSKSGNHTVTYTEWITLDTSEWTEFHVYIPTWVDTGIYDESYSATIRNDWKEASIETRVWANNSSEARRIVGYEMNTTRDMYVAVYEYPVQITGIAYDFQVTSVNDQISYGDDTNSMDNIARLAEMGIERKVGIYNRFGDKYMRYAMTEKVTDEWNPVATLPFTTGKSLYPLMGTWKKGEEFAFTFRTIAGNIDGVNDYVKITPHYRYIDTEGNVFEEDELRIYYDYASKLFIELGSERDTEITSQLIGSFTDVEFSGARNDLQFNNDGFHYYNTYELTSEITGESISDLSTRDVKYGRLGELTLGSTAMLYSGDESQLDINHMTDGENSKRYGNGLTTIGTAVQKEFSASMQTWYGMYRIPTTLRVAKRYKEDGSQFSLYSDGDVRGWFDDNTYMDGETMKELFLQDGYLVLSFDITVYIDGEASISYHDAGLDMWYRENGGLASYTAYCGSYTVMNGYVEPVQEPVHIAAQSGDIAVLPIKGTLGADGADQREAGMLWIGK